MMPSCRLLAAGFDPVRCLIPILTFTCVFAHQVLADQRPNILFCIADDATYMHFGAYGCSWVNTPGFDRVAREGLLFQRAYTPNAKCAPSRACILTGRNTWQLEEACNHMPFFPTKFVTYVEALAEEGYHTGKVAKGWAPGVANDEKGDRRQLTGVPYDKRTTKPPAKAINRSDYAANFEDFLDANSQGKPFCFWYGCTEPHRAYEYGVGSRLAGKKTADIDRVPAFWPDTEAVRNDMLDYAYEIEHFDKHLSRMLDSLQRRGLLENTLVVVTADNGMPFPRIKGQEYEYSNHLPLAMMWKQGIRKPGRVIEDFVSFIDFAPTFLDVAGAKQTDTNMQPITGTSLLPIFQSAADGQVIADRDHVVFGKERHDVGRPNDGGYPMRGIVQDGFLYLKNFAANRWPAGDPKTGYLNCDGSPTKSLILEMRRNGTNPGFWSLSFGKRPSEELYHIDVDPECMHNLADEPQHAATKQGLAATLIARLKAEGDPRVLGQPDVFDNYPVASPAARFYERFMMGERPRAGWVNPEDYETEELE